MGSLVRSKSFTPKLPQIFALLHEPHISRMHARPDPYCNFRADTSTYFQAYFRLLRWIYAETLCEFPTLLWAFKHVCRLPPLLCSCVTKPIVVHFSPPVHPEDEEVYRRKWQYWMGHLLLVALVMVWHTYGVDLQKHKSTANSMFVLLKSKNYTFIVY